MRLCCSSFFFMSVFLLCRFHLALLRDLLHRRRIFHYHCAVCIKCIWYSFDISPLPIIRFEATRNEASCGDKFKGPTGTKTAILSKKKREQRSEAKVRREFQMWLFGCTIFYFLSAFTDKCKMYKEKKVVPPNEINKNTEIKNWMKIQILMCMIL